MIFSQWSRSKEIPHIRAHRGGRLDDRVRAGADHHPAKGKLQHSGVDLDVVVGVDLLVQVTAGQHQITWAPILWAQRDVKHAFNDGLIASDRLFIALHRFFLSFGFIV